MVNSRQDLMSRIGRQVGPQGHAIDRGLPHVYVRVEVSIQAPSDVCLGRRRSLITIADSLLGCPTYI